MSDASRNQPRSIGELIGKGTALGALAETAGRHLDLAAHVRAALAEPLGQFISACNLRSDGTLVITAANPEWAARLRFESDAILGTCRERFPAAARIKIRVDTNPGA